MYTYIHTYIHIHTHIHTYTHTPRWDVSRVTDMNSMFEEADAFSSDISRWDTHTYTHTYTHIHTHTHTYTHMHAHTHTCTHIHKYTHTPRWDVSRVTDMKEMFSLAISFNSDISR